LSEISQFTDIDLHELTCYCTKLTHGVDTLQLFYRVLLRFVICRVSEDDETTDATVFTESRGTYLFMAYFSMSSQKNESICIAKRNLCHSL